MNPDFTAHPYLGLIAAAALEEFRFALAKDVTLPLPSSRDAQTPSALPVLRGA